MLSPKRNRQQAHYTGHYHSITTALSAGEGAAAVTTATTAKLSPAKTTAVHGYFGGKLELVESVGSVESVEDGASRASLLEVRSCTGEQVGAATRSAGDCSLVDWVESGKLSETGGLRRGTGSIPPGFKGWQRQIRLVPSHTPLTRPHSWIASKVYWEQLG